MIQVPELCRTTKRNGNSISGQRTPLTQRTFLLFSDILAVVFNFLTLQYEQNIHTSSVKKKIYLHSPCSLETGQTFANGSFSSLVSKSLNMSITCTIKVIKLPDIIHISFKMLAIDGVVLHFSLIFVRYLFVFTVKSKLSSNTLRSFLMKDDG